MSNFVDQIKVSDELCFESVQIGQSDLFFEIIKKNRPYFSKIDFISPEFESLEAVKSVIKSLIDYKNKNSGVNYGLWKANNLSGFFTVNRVDWEKSSADVGFWLIESATGKGYASLAFSILCCELKKLGLIQLTASTAITNKRAQALLEKNGFRKQKILERHITVRGSKIDEFLYDLSW